MHLRGDADRDGAVNPRRLFREGLIADRLQTTGKPQQVFGFRRPHVSQPESDDVVVKRRDGILLPQNLLQPAGDFLTYGSAGFPPEPGFQCIDIVDDQRQDGELPGPACGFGLFSQFISSSRDSRREVDWTFEAG